jgi:hypothetical protein
LGREIPPPCFHGKANITSDGYVLCDFTDSEGNRHMGAFVGSWKDLQANYVGLSRHLELTQGEQGEFANMLEAWVSAKRASLLLDLPKTKRLRKAYNAAVASGAEQFTFEGHEVLTRYAKYMLEYLDGKFDMERKK